MDSLSMGCQRPEVADIQKALCRAGFLWEPFDEDFGLRTLGAVIAFQRSRGLVRDGVVGPKTWESLFPQGPPFPLPGNMNAFVRGIDVSHHQGALDWEKVRQAGVHFAFLKATEGSTLADERFRRNWAGAGTAGLRRGAYHFYRPSSRGKDQAEFFLRTLDGSGPGDLPPVADLESSLTRKPGVIFWSDEAEANVEQVREFLDTVEDGLGVRPMVYTTVSFVRDILGDSPLFGAYPLWVARYPFRDKAFGIQEPPPPGGPTVLPSGWKHWDFWQYTEKGTVPGVFDETHPVDLDLFNGTPDQLKAFQAGK